VSGAACDDRVTLAILAGGAGSRMGRPKAALSIRGRPVLSWLLERFAWPGPTLLVTAPGREHPPESARFDREVSDPVAGQGPLRGILTALEQVETETVLVATVDMPGVTAAQLQWLAASLHARPAISAVLPRRAGGVRGAGDGIIEPFPSAYRRGFAEVIRGRLAAHRAAVHALSSLPDVAVLEVPHDWPDDTWINLNEPADLARFNGVE
jgi:molybdenum cofactor guanylyltransferase